MYVADVPLCVTVADRLIQPYAYAYYVHNAIEKKYIAAD